jgi:hypothetical protein
VLPGKGLEGRVSLDGRESGHRLQYLRSLSLCLVYRRLEQNQCRKIALNL